MGNLRMVQVYRAHNLMDARLVCALLEETGLRAEISSALPFDLPAAGRWPLDPIVYVAHADYDWARRILADLKQSDRLS